MTALGLLRGMRFKGINRMGMITLMSLHKSPLTNGDLCVLQDADSSTVSTHIKGMMKRGYVRLANKKSPKDARVNFYELTDSGLETMKGVFQYEEDNPIEK